MIKNQVTGSSAFSDASIRRLKQFSMELDVFLMLKNLRKLSFNKDKKVLIDLNSLAPIEIKNNTQCILVSNSNNYAHITIGLFSFIVKKSDIKKI